MGPHPSSLTQRPRREGLGRQKNSRAPTGIVFPGQGIGCASLTRLAPFLPLTKGGYVVHIVPQVREGSKRESMRNGTWDSASLTESGGAWSGSFPASAWLLSEGLGSVTRQPPCPERRACLVGFVSRGRDRVLPALLGNRRVAVPRGRRRTWGNACRRGKTHQSNASRARFDCARLNRRRTGQAGFV